MFCSGYLTWFFFFSWQSLFQLFSLFPVHIVSRCQQMCSLCSHFSFAVSLAQTDPSKVCVFHFTSLSGMRTKWSACFSCNGGRMRVVSFPQCPLWKSPDSLQGCDTGGIDTTLSGLSIWQYFERPSKLCTWKEGTESFPGWGTWNLQPINNCGKVVLLPKNADRELNAPDEEWGGYSLIN